MSLGDEGRGLADGVPALLYARAHDAAWTLLRVSAGGAALLGRHPEDLGPGSSLLAAVHPDDRARALQAVDNALAADGGYAVSYRLAGDAPRWVLDRGRRRGHELVGVVVELERDQTEDRAVRAQLEARLWEAQKLEAVGRLAGGVAHDFNNALTAVLGHAALLRPKLEPDPGAALQLATIEEAARRAAQLTQQLLGFARKGKVQDVVFDLATVVDDALGLLDRGLDDSVRIVRPEPVALAVRGDPGQIQQVVLNLALNAREAIATKGGTITIAIRRVELDGAEAAAHPGASRGSYAVLSVRDDGPGVPEAERALIFEPFFTTKPQGTGMGLPMVYGIVKNHGGFMVLDTQEARGATFDVYLPIVKAQRPSESAEFAVIDAAERATVLFVDDEEFVRYAARAQIQTLGHTVILAKDGEEAVEVFRARGAEIDLVILDLTMPRMDGAACFRALRALDAAVKVILSTGFGRDGVVEDVLEMGVSGFLEKPYRQAELARAIEGALRG